MELMVLYIQYVPGWSNNSNCVPVIVFLAVLYSYHYYMDNNNNGHKQAPSFVLDKSSLVEDLNALLQFLGPEPNIKSGAHNNRIKQETKMVHKRTKIIYH